MAYGHVLAGAIGQRADQRPYLADNFGMIGAERDVGVGIIRLEGDRPFGAGEAVIERPGYTRPGMLAVS